MEIENIIKSLSFFHTVKDIMITENKIAFANTLEEAKIIAKENQYSIIPKISNNKIRKYYDVRAKKLKDIEYGEIISSDTSILELIDLFQAHKYLFIIGKQKIIGMVHYSDLNNPIVKLILYLLIENIERLIYQRLNCLTEKEILSYISESIKTKVLKRKDNLTKFDLENKWFGTFGFNELLKIAAKLEMIEIRSDIIGTMKIVRDKVAHTHRTLIDDNKVSYKNLLLVKNSCLKIINTLGK